ncbi:MAG TPA: sigma 54-interacting transcriptional regulator [Myxococcota bacterium]|nr:sigma 54-interacting transcriptional regulator [Myxococcota bacterium]
MGDEIDRLRTENDFHRRLLDLSTERDVERFLREALVLVLELTGATRGYLELREPRLAPTEPVWWMSQGCGPEEVADIRRSLSRGIIAEAIATQATIATSSALLDPRFGGRESVRASGIEAVLCAPIGRDPVQGVVYLAGATRGESWSETERGWVELFARHLAPLAHSLLERQPQEAQGDALAAVPASFSYEGVVGRSEALAAALGQAALLAPLDVPVLLTGESGTGKSQLAELIHRNSPRRAGPFVEINCATLPQDLIESELFGALAGAHSTARRPQRGKVSTAEGGTLFLDEIAEIPHHAQAKLLQLIQSKQYYALGSAEPSFADVRVIAATNTDLARALAERRFREDLYFRLSVMPIRMPTVAERTGDVAALARHLADQACRKHGFARLELSPRAVRAVETAEWPGNVRQLSNAVEAAAIRANGQRALRIEVSHLFPGAAGAERDLEPEATTFQEATREFQRALLQKTLRETHWNVSETARRLDLVRSHVYTLMDAFGIERGK